MRAPHSAIGGATNNSFQGEDLDVLADLVYSRRDEQANPPGRVKCRPFIDAIKATVARETGDRTPIWEERSYMKDVAKLKAATLIAHGNNDFNVMTKNAAQLYEALKAQGTPSMFFFSPRRPLAARRRTSWSTCGSRKYLYGQDNGVENLAAVVGRARDGDLPAA